jgi:hypothetical protein
VAVRAYVLCAFLFYIVYLSHTHTVPLEHLNDTKKAQLAWEAARQAALARPAYVDVLTCARIPDESWTCADVCSWLEKVRTCVCVCVCMSESFTPSIALHFLLYNTYTVHCTLHTAPLHTGLQPA